MIRCRYAVGTYNLQPGPFLLDTDDCWDGNPTSLVQDLVHLACDFVHSADDDRGVGGGEAKIMYGRERRRAGWSWRAFLP
jgi:hypothetical protein